MPVRAPMKKAVLVGICSDSKTPLGKVPGAHKDVQKLEKLLKEKYNYQDITMLVDTSKAQAHQWPSEKNILKAMKDLVANTQPGDHIVFSFSGHGAQVVPINDKNERDGKDEILITADCTEVVVDKKSGDSKYSHFIRDDIIREIFVDQLPEGIHCTLIFDCCHSGTAGDLPEVEDEDEDSYKRSHPKSRAPGFRKEETLHHGHAASAKARESDMAAGSQGKGRVPVKKVTSWSACLDQQVTYGRPGGGVFINAFVDILQNTDNKITHGDFLLRLRTEIEKVFKEKEKSNIINIPLAQLGSLEPHHILNEPFTL